MKTITTVTFTIASLIFLMATTALVGRADEMKDAVKSKTYTGRITAVDAKERTMKAKGFLFAKSFHFGEHCAVTIGDNKSTSVSDLRPGQRIEITYQDAGGVLVASRVKRLPMTYAGRVEQIDAEKRSLTVREGKKSMTFALAEDCKFTLAGGKEGKLDALVPGYKVTVLYELPPEGALARQVEQKYETFTGSLIAVDAQTRTVKAKQLIGGKTFQLARDCRIVLNGKQDAGLNDLRLGQKFTFSFEEVDGVNVANCVAGAETPSTTSATASAQ